MKEPDKVSVAIGDLKSSGFCSVCGKFVGGEKIFWVNVKGSHILHVCPECGFDLGCELQVAYSKAKRKSNKKPKKEQV